MWQVIASKVSDSIGESFQCQTISPVGGGDINQAAVVSDTGNKFFIKWNHANRIDMFEKEVFSLQTIANSQSVKVPQVINFGIAESSSYLVLEYLELHSKANKTKLAEQLAKMHLYNRHEGKFGFDQDNYIGYSEQSNQWRADWIDFFQELRLGKQMEMLQSKKGSTRLIDDLTQLQQQLGKFFVDYQPKPSLVHGDLWQGNYDFTASGEAVIYDPACYYADFEVDLAMMELFGNPGSDFFAAYHRINPIHSGYNIRKLLYNLYHILNHANMFGGGYLDQAQNMTHRLLAHR